MKRLFRFSSFVIFPALGAVLLYLSGRRVQPERFGELPCLFPAGLFLWTILEYGLHRFAFHSRSVILNRLHLEHHVEPRNPDLILVRPSIALGISALLIAVLAGLARDPFRVAGIMTGVWSGFLYYESVHYRVHMSLVDSKLLQAQRRAHFIHHYSDARIGFGVTSPLWDRILGTDPKRQ